MKDFDSIWRTQDEIRTVVNAVLGECIWNLSYNERRMAIELEITKYLEGFSPPAFLFCKKISNFDVSSKILTLGNTQI